MFTSHCCKRYFYRRISVDWGSHLHLNQINFTLTISQCRPQREVTASKWRALTNFKAWVQIRMLHHQFLKCFQIIQFPLRHKNLKFEVFVVICRCSVFHNHRLLCTYILLFDISVKWKEKVTYLKWAQKNNNNNWNFLVISLNTRCRPVRCYAKHQTDKNKCF